MDVNDALIFCHQVTLLKKACALNRGNSSQQVLSFPADAPSFVDPLIGCKFNGRYAIKTPIWAIQHCLSSIQSSGKTYSIEVSNSLEFLNVADGAFIICGLLNLQCVPQEG